MILLEYNNRILNDTIDRILRSKKIKQNEIYKKSKLTFEF